jgi:hypothetical protein
MTSLTFFTEFYHLAPATPLEVVTDSAIEDQIEAWRDEAFAFLMMALRNESEVEKVAARQILLGKDWQVEPREFHNELGRIEEESAAVVYEYSAGRKMAWARIWADDLASDIRTLTRLGETALAVEFSHLLAQINDASNQRPDRAYPARSAGTFGKYTPAA